MKQNHSKIRIETDGIAGKVFIDGRKVDGIVGLKYEHDAGEIPRLHITLNALNMEIDADVADVERTTCQRESE